MVVSDHVFFFFYLYLGEHVLIVWHLSSVVTRWLNTLPVTNISPFKIDQKIGHPQKKDLLPKIHLKRLFYYVVVSNIFYFHPYLGKISILTNIFQMGWNHQLVLPFKGVYSNTVLARLGHYWVHLLEMIFSPLKSAATTTTTTTTRWAPTGYTWRSWGYTPYEYGYNSSYPFIFGHLWWFL